MPRLLSPTTLHPAPTRARWTAVLTAAAIMTAWNFGWHDTLRGALTPTSSHTYAWNTDDLTTAEALTDQTELLPGIDDPTAAEARTLPVPAENLTLDLLWEPTLTITDIRLETYTDAYGTGHRLGIAAHTHTQTGPECLNARITTPAGETTVQTCTRSDQHPPVDMAEFLGKEESDDWSPDHLFVTQTANLDPADYSDTTQIDYYGLGLNLGDANESGLWGPNWTEPMTNLQHCDGRPHNFILAIDDLHLTDQYPDPAQHRRTAPERIAGSPQHFAYPAEEQLLTPACIPVNHRGGMNPQSFHQLATEPFQKPTSTPLSGWVRYNAATRDPQPLRTALVIDVRSCDTTPGHCTGDRAIDPHSYNTGPGREWMRHLLGIDCIHAIGNPCPHLGT
ncbi:hypothetical protein GCM10027447_30690 [Glycomyces halotolerans]